MGFLSTEDAARLGMHVCALSSRLLASPDSLASKCEGFKTSEQMHEQRP